jgi:hypothetical protein
VRHGTAQEKEKEKEHEMVKKIKHEKANILQRNKGA